jgi:excisionase family DNA binding protein
VKAPEREFTTFQAAKICGVFHTTVINWVNKGKLPARLTPGGHRRIALSDLVKFMQAWDMPVPPDLTTRPKRALVVEDDAAVQRMLTRCLSGIPDLEISACTSGLEALMLIGKEAPDVLVLDIRIPQVDGIEVCRLIRQSSHTQGVRVVAVTGQDLSRKDEAALASMAEGVLRKPFSSEKLKRLIQDLLDSPSAAEAQS